MLVVNKSGFSKHLYNEMFILLRFSDLMFSCLVREVTGSRLACNDKLCHLVKVRTTIGGTYSTHKAVCFCTVKSKLCKKSHVFLSRKYAVIYVKDTKLLANNKYNIMDLKFQI